MVNKANVSWALVNEYLSSTVDSEIFLWNTFVLINCGYFVIVTYLDKNEIFMTKGPPATDTIIFKVDMKVNNNNDVTMKLQR